MNFLMFISQLPASPSSLRVMVWRRLKAAGALGLQNGVWVLPAGEEQERFLVELLDYVVSQAASGQIFQVSSLNEFVENDILARFRLDREGEYDEFLEQCLVMLAELEREAGRQKFTFAELEENEQNLQKLTGWLAKIQARDFFGAGKGQLAVEKLLECQRMMEAFVEKVNRQVQAENSMDAELEEKTHSHHLFHPED